MDLLAGLARKLGTYLTEVGSIGSIYGFLLAAAVATLFLFLRRRRRNLRMLGVILRKLFAPRIWLARSSRLDAAMLLFNVLVFPVIFLGAVLSYDAIAGGLYAWLGQTFGAPPAPRVPGWAASALITATLFVAYEFAYYLDHYLSHKVAFLWEFHRVHHSATVLTPLTNWRMHPVDAVLFFNLIAVITGSTQAVVHHALGVQAAPYLIQGENLFFLAYIYLYGHLQHSHVWMTFSGVWSRILMSPAAHQIHHSTNPRHFDRNFGGAFAFWDWLFGTLHVPDRTREVHQVGLKDDQMRDSLFVSLIHPVHAVFERTARALTPRPTRPRETD